MTTKRIRLRKYKSPPANSHQQPNCRNCKEGNQSTDNNNNNYNGINNKARCLGSSRGGGRIQGWPVQGAWDPRRRPGNWPSVLCLENNKFAKNESQNLAPVRCAPAAATQQQQRSDDAQVGALNHTQVRCAPGRLSHKGTQNWEF